MIGYQKLSSGEIKKRYALIKEYHQKYLKKHGVDLPKLYDTEKRFTKNALALVYLSIGYPKTKVVSKTELTGFIRNFYPDTPDVQQARHLGAQSGWWIVAGGRDNIVVKVKRGFYQLYTLERPYPAFKKGHRLKDTGNWQEIKARYGNRCATCGSVEGEPHLHWSGTKTILQKAHKDPNKPLRPGNIIPQCQKCNRADRNRWVYDDKGRVIKLAKPNFILNSDKEVVWKVHQILYKKFGGKNPNAKRQVS